MSKISTRQARGPIRALEPFTSHGALRGEAFGDPYQPTAWDSGRLSGSPLAQFHADRPVIDYVVFSYATPIAWHTAAGWYSVSQKFSMTTSHHQGQCPMTDRTDLIASEVTR